MIGLRVLLTAVAILVSTGETEAQGLPHYRGFVLGSTLATAAGAAAQIADAKTVHQRPALLQILEWRPARYKEGGAVAEPDSVRLVGLSFYNDQLYRIAVDYDRERTEGMTDADLIEGVSLLYGPVVPVAAKRAQAPIFLPDDETGPVLARWIGEGYAVTLHRSLYATGFRLIVSSPRLDGLARAADVEARRLDDKEAPQRELAKQKKSAAAREKARLANKAVFKG